MNSRDLSYLVALSDYKHFGKAAEACFVSQPALSMQIKKLEETLGVKLLERTNKSVMLTDVGAVIAEQAKRILQQIDELRDIAKIAKDPYQGELKLGVIPTLAPYLLPLIMKALSKAFPNLTLFLVEEQTTSLIQALKDGKIDAAFLALPIPDKALTSALLFEEEFMLVTPPNHPLAKQKSIKEHHLDQQDLLLLDEGHCMRDQILSYCTKMKAAESQRFRATSLETLRHMVAAGAGITLMPKLAHQSNDGLVYIPFSNPRPTRQIALCWRTSSPKQLLLDDITQTIRKSLKKHSDRLKVEAAKE